jgi:tetratricopeptide (TPR) repeat protein
MIHTRSIGQATADPERAYTRARIALSQARQLGGESARVYSALSQLYRLVEWDWDKSFEYGLRAVELDPSDSDAQTFCSLCLSYSGDFESAEPYAKRALEIDPVNPMAFMGIGTLLLAQGRLDEVDRQIAEYLDRNPNHLFALLNRTMVNLLRGDWQRARRDAESAAEVSSRAPAYISLTGCCAALDGDMARAEECLAELQQVREITFVSATSVGTLLYLLGRTDEAYSELFDGYRNRDFGLLWYIRINFFSIPPFRDDERLQRLIARIGIK